jgi:molybdopterin synthase catalytic subunit
VLRISREPIDPRQLEDAVRTSDAGGVVTFLGVVRRHADDGRLVDALTYEAFERMAVAEFVSIAQEASDRFGAGRIAIVHRIGDLAIGEIAVAVAASATHRKAAFEACEYAIDEVKRRAPIWKKEHFVDGMPQWKANA